MKTTDIKNWETALRTKFPTVVLRSNDEVPQFGGVPVLDVFFVPDNRDGEFLEFLINHEDELREQFKLPDVDFLPVNESQTRKFHPEMLPAQVELQAS